MQPVGRNRWVVEVRLPPGRHEYFFVADGVRVTAPNAGRYERHVSGGLNAILHL